MFMFLHYQSIACATTACFVNYNLVLSTDVFDIPQFLNFPSDVCRQTHSSHAYCTTYITVSQKSIPLNFDNNFSKCGPIFKILSPTDLWEKFSMYTHKDCYLTCNMLLHYLVKFENPEMLLISTAEGNGDLETLICVLVARPRRCLTLSNPVPWQNWMAAYLGYTLRMKMLFYGWPVTARETHTRRRQHPQQTVHMFLRTLWTLDLTFDSS